MMNIPAQLCTGCGACCNICPQMCIDMQTDKDGFCYPQINDEICHKCHLCEKICPVIQKQEIVTQPQIYAAYCREQGILQASSSGGIFTLLAERVLEDGGVVFGAGFDANFGVIHDFTENKSGLDKFRGSKYVQSKIGDVYQKVSGFLDVGRPVYFSGTPCQIGGLLAYLREPYDNLYTQDFICHGVPTPQVWKKYISYRENQAGSPVQRISFRCKDYGWKRFSMLFVFKNNRKYLKVHKKDLYMRAFLQNICLRPSCYNCSFKSVYRQSDITLADFWGVNKILPEINNESGVSLIMANNEAGRKLFADIKPRIHFAATDINAVKNNFSLTQSVKPHKKRREFLDSLGQIPFRGLVNRYCSGNLTVTVKDWIHTLLVKTGLHRKIK